jgi:hypothetical protein
MTFDDESLEAEADEECQQQPRNYASETAPEDQCCQAMLYAVRADDLPVEYDRALRAWGIAYQDGGSAVQSIQYCPWCGTKLPTDLGDEWSARLERMDLEPGDPCIPEEMQDDRWWKAEGL